MEMYNIPKIIHYCWFGKGEKSDLAKKCIGEWEKKLNDYKIVEWNEDNFDVNINRYVKEAYESKKYAFVSDYVRLFVLFNYGGIYLDTDIEVLKSFDNMLALNGFAGFEDKELISTAVIGAKKGNLIIKDWLDTYEERSFIEKGKINETTNVRVFTNLLLMYGLKQNNTNIQIIKDGEITIFPREYFSPLKIGEKKPNITESSITIHWFEGTWLTTSKKVKIKIISTIKKIIGFKNYNNLKSYIKREQI